jgi:hypothetical protein
MASCIETLKVCALLFAVMAVVSAAGLVIHWRRRREGV